MSTEKSDHDLLIELSTKMEIWHKSITDVFANHTKEDAVSFDKLERTVTAAHKRLDTFGSLKDRILGGTAVISFLFGIAAWLINIYKG